MKYNENKDAALGMSASTASHKLRKIVLFELALRLDLLTCYRCNTPIEKYQDLSLDHKVNWLHSDNPVFNFFDISNISFSHLLCNISADRYRKWPTEKEKIQDKYNRLKSNPNKYEAFLKYKRDRYKLRK